MLTEPNKLSVS